MEHRTCLAVSCTVISNMHSNKVGGFHQCQRPNTPVGIKGNVYKSESNNGKFCIEIHVLFLAQLLVLSAG